MKRTLRKCSTSSSPEADQIAYFYLRILPSTHYFLATLFTKILLETNEGPQSMFSAEITLIPKGGDPSNPKNFRPIALSSVIPKLFHKIVAKQLESYLLKNGIINPSIQKGFLSGVNGTAEHIFTTTAIIDNAIQHGSPLVVAFLDLQNAFGSVAHVLITDILTHIKLPDSLITYISDGYSNLTGYVKTKDWKSPMFKIKCGMFQGDTLSPVIILTVFNPLIELSSRHTTSVYSLKVPVPNSVGLP